MASEYLERSKSAKKSMGPAAKKERRKQSRAANEAVAFVAAGPKETRGKYQELGVGGFKMIAASIGKMAADTGSDDAFRALSTTAKLAAKGNKQAQKRILSIANRSVASFDIEVSKGVAAGGRAPASRSMANMGRTGLRVYERGLAKIFGQAGRAEPGFRKMGKTAKAASQERYLETTFPTGMRQGYTYDRYAGTPTRRLPDGSIKVKNTKIDEYGNEFPRPGFKRMVRKGR